MRPDPEADEKRQRARDAELEWWVDLLAQAVTIPEVGRLLADTVAANLPPAPPKPPRPAGPPSGRQQRGGRQRRG